MKQFLRYQVSGSVFIFWIVIFYFGKDTDTFISIIREIHQHIGGFKSIVGLISALPIGVLLHQISVQIKNWIIAKCIKEFDDFPNRKQLNSINDNQLYILERISNLNSFYYIRFDNGILAPLFAYIIISTSIEGNIHSIWIFSAIIIGIVLNSYLVRIKHEITEYNLLLEQKN